MCVCVRVTRRRPRPHHAGEHAAGVWGVRMPAGSAQQGRAPRPPQRGGGTQHRSSPLSPDAPRRRSARGAARACLARWRRHARVSRRRHARVSRTSVGRLRGARAQLPERGRCASQYEVQRACDLLGARAQERNFAFAEFRSVEEASNAMGLDGVAWRDSFLKVRVRPGAAAAHARAYACTAGARRRAVRLRVDTRAATTTALAAWRFRQVPEGGDEALRGSSAALWEGASRPLAGPPESCFLATKRPALSGSPVMNCTRCLIRCGGRPTTTWPPRSCWAPSRQTPPWTRPSFSSPSR